jgi:glutathione S-transferase
VFGDRKDRMKLYFTKGACSLHVHIALLESGLPFELVEVDLRDKRTLAGTDFMAINPKGCVPALQLEDGEVITEGAVVVQYIADRRPQSGLAPPPGSRDRRRLQEWLHFIATELHKAFGPINHPKSNDELRAALKARLATRFSVLARQLAEGEFLLGSHFTVADGYAFYVLRNWQRLDDAGFASAPVLGSYLQRLAQRPAVSAALAREGLA